MSDEIQEFKKDRDKALLEGDEAVRAFAKKYKIAIPTDPRVRERARLKAITAVPGLPIESRKDAKQRLDALGSSSMDDGDL